MGTPPIPNYLYVHRIVIEPGCSPSSRKPSPNLKNEMMPEDRLQNADATEGPDVFFVSASLDRSTAYRLYEAHKQSGRRKHCVLILTTSGGDADAAYLMARYLRRSYEKVTICVFGYCKSAGTLLALGAHEIVMGERGELGPLDVQVSTKDEMFPSRSGLEIFASLEVLKAHAFESFERYLLEVVTRSGGQITTKTAARVATELTVGLLAPMAAQIDPHRLGHEQRALDIAGRYAMLLGVPPNVVARLTTAYPSHGFVIDLEEAREFLPADAVREPNDAERVLEAELAKQNMALYYPDPNPPGIVECLTPPPQPNSDHDTTETHAISRNAEAVSAEASGRDMEDRPASDQPIESPAGRPAAH